MQFILQGAIFGEESPGQQICPSIKKGGNTMGTRITEHPIFGVPQKGRLVNFTYDGQKIQGYEGEPIAAALKAAGILIHRYTKKEHTPRGIFCAIGRCHRLCYGCGRSSKRENLCNPAEGRNEGSDTIWCIGRAI